MAFEPGALLPQEQDWLVQGMELARDALLLQRRIQLHRKMYDQNSFGASISDADLLEYEAFYHLTNAEVVSMVTGLDTVDTALGDLVNGQAVNLLKVLRNLPF